MLWSSWRCASCLDKHITLTRSWASIPPPWTRDTISTIMDATKKIKTSQTDRDRVVTIAVGEVGGFCERKRLGTTWISLGSSSSPRGRRGWAGRPHLDSGTGSHERGCVGKVRVTHVKCEIKTNTVVDHDRKKENEREVAKDAEEKLLKMS
jgi:hypothetical protein